MHDASDFFAALFIGGHPHVRREISQTRIYVEGRSQIFLKAKSQHSRALVNQLLRELKRTRESLEYLVKDEQVPFVRHAEGVRLVHRLTMDVEDGRILHREKVVGTRLDHWGLAATGISQA